MTEIPLEPVPANDADPDAVVPDAALCPGCNGTGTIGDRTCPTCEGSGRIFEARGED